MNIAIVTTGDKATDVMMRELPKKMQKKGVRKATRASAKIVMADAKRLVAVDEGRLEKSLTVRAAKGRGGRRLMKGTMGHAVSTREGMFSGETFYGGFLEYGTAQRATQAGENRGVLEQDAFLRPALYGNQRLVRWTFRRTLQQAVREIAAESRAK